MTHKSTVTLLVTSEHPLSDVDLKIDLIDPNKALNASEFKVVNIKTKKVKDDTVLHALLNEAEAEFEKAEKAFSDCETDHELYIDMIHWNNVCVWLNGKLKS